MDFYHGFNTSKNHYLEKQILDLFHSLSVPGNTHPNFDELYYRKIFEQSDSSKMYYIYTIILSNIILLKIYSKQNKRYHELYGRGSVIPYMTIIAYLKNKHLI